MPAQLSIIIPARNEADSLRRLLPELRSAYPDAEILVVDDGSEDGTAEACAAAGAKPVRLPYSMGNGAAVKAGVRAATGETIVLMDGDGQHLPSEIPKLLAELSKGHAMAVGARRAAAHTGAGRLWANRFYNILASLITGRRIADLTSGFRAASARHFREFLYILPNGFSYPTTVTMAFLRAGYPVCFVPVDVKPAENGSHIRPLADGVRFLLIIFRIGTLYSPLKIFVPMSVLLLSGGLANYAWTYVTEARFTNMSAMLLLAGLITFLIGLVAEQITALMYQRRD